MHGTLVVGVSQTLRHWTDGATYIRQGGHHVGHWPTFLVTYSFYMWRKYDVGVTLMTLTDELRQRLLRVWGGSESRWLMTLACLCSCQWRTFWTYLTTVTLFSLYLVNFMFHTTHDAVGNIVRVHYESMKCDVSFSQGNCSVSSNVHLA